MITMTINALKVTPIITVKIFNVGLKYYSYGENVVNSLYKRFKSDQPDQIIIKNGNEYVDQFLDMIIDEGYLIDKNGYIKEASEVKVCFNTVEKMIEQERDEVILVFKDEYDQMEVVQLLLKNNYIVATSVTDEKFNVIVKGLNK